MPCTTSRRPSSCTTARISALELSPLGECRLRIGAGRLDLELGHDAHGARMEGVQRGEHLWSRRDIGLRDSAPSRGPRPIPWTGWLSGPGPARSPETSAAVRRLRRSAAQVAGAARPARVQRISGPGWRASHAASPRVAPAVRRRCRRSRARPSRPVPHARPPTRRRPRRPGARRAWRPQGTRGDRRQRPGRARPVGTIAARRSHANAAVATWCWTGTAPRRGEGPCMTRRAPPTARAGARRSGAGRGSPAASP